MEAKKGYASILSWGTFNWSVWVVIERSGNFHSATYGG